MSLKAGRVGVNPADVDPVSGHLDPSSVDAYTKAQADDKFLTKTAAASTYESKEDASTAHNLLQPKTLELPIHMLSGSKFTVETALQGLNTDKTDNDVTVSAVTDIVTDATVDADVGNELYKHGKIVTMSLLLRNITQTSWHSLFIIPAGFRPKHRFNFKDLEGHLHAFGTDGTVKCAVDLSNSVATFQVTWMTD